MERLDYLQELGVNALYFTPVFQSASNHRYHTHDYFNVDPMLGGNSALKALLDAAHRRGMKVVLDGVFNHCSRGFFQFNDICENGSASAYIDWFHIRGYPLAPYPCPSDVHPAPPDCNYDCWWGLPALPKFNTSCPAVREFLWSVAEHWIKFGIDGWRLDVPSEINDDDFWREFRRRVKAINPDAYIVGEIWEDATRWLKGDQFDAVMCYPFTRLCLGFFGKHTLDPETFKGTGYGHVKTFKTGLQFLGDLDAELDRYSWEITQAQLMLLGSHDVPRFLTCVQGDTTAYKLSLLLAATLPGAPCIYYGDEIGMSGGRDPECRRGMIWDESRWNKDLLSFIKRVLKMRHAHAVLRRGGFQALYGDPKHMVFAFQRKLSSEAETGTAMIVFNAGLDEVKVDFGGAEPGLYTEVIGGISGESRYDVTFEVEQDGRAVFRVLARTAWVFLKTCT